MQFYPQFFPNLVVPFSFEFLCGTLVNIIFFIFFLLSFANVIVSIINNLYLHIDGLLK